MGKADSILSKSQHNKSWIGDNEKPETTYKKAVSTLKKGVKI